MEFSKKLDGRVWDRTEMFDIGPRWYDRISENRRKWPKSDGRGLKPNRSVEQRNEIIRMNVGNGRKRPKSFGTVHNRGEESDIRHKGTWWNKSSLFVVIKISKGWQRNGDTDSYWSISEQSISYCIIKILSSSLLCSRKWIFKYLISHQFRSLLSVHFPCSLWFYSCLFGYLTLELSRSDCWFSPLAAKHFLVN